MTATFWSAALLRRFEYTANSPIQSSLILDTNCIDQA